MSGYRSSAPPPQEVNVHHGPSLAPFALTVGDRVAPLGVEGEPQFGWLLSGSGSDQHQKAYQIALFAAGTDGVGEPLWDSGKIYSSATACRPYGGPALAGGCGYEWSLRVWDAADRVSVWTSPVPFDTALTDDQWSADVIRRRADEVDEYTLARREFAVGSSPIRRARLFLSACHQYQAFIDGRLVAQGPAYAYPGEGYYQVVDVTAAVRAGARATIGVLYHWYGPGQGRPEGAPGLLAQLVADRADGSRLIVPSDGQWRVKPGSWLPAPWRNDDGRDYVERIDGRRQSQDAGWAGTGFDDSSWERPLVLPRREHEMFARLRAQPTQLQHHVVAPVSAWTLAGGGLVADFGTVIPAIPRVRFRAGVSGRRIDLRAGYLLADDGSVSAAERDNQLTDMSYGYIQDDGDQTFEPMTYEGFRYLQIDAPGTGPVTGPDAADIEAIVQHTEIDPARTATFDSSDTTLNEVFALLQRSALFSAQHQFLDTPTREKGQFLADAVNISRALMAGFGDRAMTARTIEEFVQSGHRYWPDGRLNAVYPNGDGRRDIPDFTELFPGWVWDYYLASGDKVTLAAAHPTCRAIAQYVRRHLDPVTGLVTDLTGGGEGPYRFGIVDWPRRYDYDLATSARTTVNLLAVDVLRTTAWQGEVLGVPGSVTDDLRSEADRLIAAINARLRREDGVYVDGLYQNGTPSPHTSQIANAYALAFDVVSPADRAALSDHLAEGDLRMGPMTAHLLLEALDRLDRPDLVLERLTARTGRGWANILARGGTFTWESWEAPEFGESLSHGWGSTAVTAIQRSLLGVRATSPAARTLRIAPPRGTTLTWASGTLWTQAGPVTVQWRTVPEGTELTVELPANVTAEIHLPAARKGPGAEEVTVHPAGPGRSRFGPV